MRLPTVVVVLAGVSAACAPSGNRGEEAAALRVYSLECGRIQSTNMDMFSDGGEYAGQPGDLIVSCFLIRHPQGDLLWDAGLPDSMAESPQGGMTVPRTLSSQLEELGLTPGDIEYLAISHSHNDHAGNGNMFAASTWISDPAERRWMFRDEARQQASFANYRDLEDAETIDVTEDYDVFGDGTVQIIRTPGHTPGHLALLVRLQDGPPILLSGDLYHLNESRQHRRVPRFNVDREQTLASMDKFEDLARRTSARVIIQHRFEDFDSLPKPPEYLR